MVTYNQTSIARTQSSTKNQTTKKENNMNASANQGSNNYGDQGQMERKVETVDISSSAGQGQEQIRTVEIVHEASNTTGGILANAAASVASTLQSAKDAISRK